LSGDLWEGKIVNRRKSGGLYYAHQTIAPITDETGAVKEFVAIQTEVTDIEEMQRQLEAHDDILRHELRTQLSVIRAHTEQIEAQGDAEPHQTEGIIQAIDELLSTAQKTRDLQRFLEQTIEPSPIDLVPLVKETVSAQRDRFPDATITCNIPSKAVALSVGEIRRALSELIENGIKHNDRSSPEITVSVIPGSESVELVIADDGPGIPPIEYETYEDTVSTQLNHRTGGGLDLAYWIARRSGGQLSVTDREPRGSRVTIRLLTPEKT
jgi:signal transduction histidine kinase